MTEGEKVRIRIGCKFVGGASADTGGKATTWTEVEAELFGRFAAHSAGVVDGGPEVYRVTFWQPGHKWSGSSASCMHAFETMGDARGFAREADAQLGNRDVSEIRDWVLARVACMPVRLRY